MTFKYRFEDTLTNRTKTIEKDFQILVVIRTKRREMLTINKETRIYIVTNGLTIGIKLRASFKRMMYRSSSPIR